MIKELIVLADELDKCNEKEAADFIDKLVKSAAEDEPPLQPLVPEDEGSDFPEEKTKVDFWSHKGPELVAKLKHFFTRNPDPSKWSEEDRAKVIEAMEILR